MLTMRYYCLSPAECECVGRKRERRRLGQIDIFLAFVMLCFLCFYSRLINVCAPNSAFSFPAGSCLLLPVSVVGLCLACCLFLNLHTSSAMAYLLLIETSWLSILLHQHRIRSLTSAINDSSLIKSVTWNKCNINIKEMLDSNNFCNSFSLLLSNNVLACF